MKRCATAVMACILALTMAFGLAGCNKLVPANTVVVWSVGGNEETTYLKEIRDKFNALGDEVQMTFVPIGEYKDILESYRYGGSNLPDITYVDDEYFKRFVRGGFIDPLDDLFKDSDLDIDGMWDASISRYRYDREYNTSNATDPLYCIPKDVSPTVLFYNEKVFADKGITVISVNEEDITAFNEDENFVDLNGKKKSDYPKLNDVTVEAKGYMRDLPYKSGETWKPVSDGEALVFNNRIPMSWDEIEDLGLLFTYDKDRNPNSPTTYGYYTEWWFNYGWSVGGDCVGDQNGLGEWVFTLDDANANYKVMADVTVNGTAYKASTADEVNFVTYKDKNYLAANAAAAAELVAGGKLQEFPSTLDAFTRFCALSRNPASNDPVGLGVAAQPKDSPTVNDAVGKFNRGDHTAMYVGYANQMNLITDVQWDIAPLPIYKTYNDDGSVEKIGARAGHSKSTGFAISTSSKKKDLAVKFLEFIAGEEGQKLTAEGGYYLPNNPDDAGKYYLKDSTKNVNQVIVEAAHQDPGDWWYMPDRDWIANWSQPLNQQSNSVRNSGLSLSQFFTQVKTATNAALKLHWKV